MYESTFTLERRPFAAAPQIEFYFPIQSIETSRQTITACIRRGNGPSIVIGEPGTGKTLLCNVLAEQFQSTDAVALLTCVGVRTRRALLQLIQFELGYNYRKMDEGDLRLSLMNQATNPQFQNGMVLLVDESHLLTPKLFEELRMLSNIVVEGRNRVHIVLAGNTSLEERLTSPRLEAFNQRISARCYISRFNLEETASYIQSQVSRAGGDASEVFNADAFEAVYQATGGVARLINQVCDHALILAAAGGHQLIDAAGVQEAWADLQQLPMPSPAGRMASTSDLGNVVEFGALDNESEEDDGEADTRSEFVDGDQSLIPNPETRLDIIEDHVVKCDDESFDEMFFESEATESPFEGNCGAVDEIGPTLAEDPFREEFEDEEIVVEQFGEDSHRRISVLDDERLSSATDEGRSQLESVEDENRLEDELEVTNTDVGEDSDSDPCDFFDSRADTEVDLAPAQESDLTVKDEDREQVIAEPIRHLHDDDTTENDSSDDELPAVDLEHDPECVNEDENSATISLGDLLDVRIDDATHQIEAHPNADGLTEPTTQLLDAPSSNEPDGALIDREFASDSPDETLRVSTETGAGTPVGTHPPFFTSEMIREIDDWSERDPVVVVSDMPDPQIEDIEEKVKTSQPADSSPECEPHQSTENDTNRSVKTRIYGQLFSRIRSRQGR